MLPEALNCYPETVKGLHLGQLCSGMLPGVREIEFLKRNSCTADSGFLCISFHLLLANSELKYVCGIVDRLVQLSGNQFVQILNSPNL